MSSRDQKKKEKEKKARETEKFDSNVDLDLIAGSSGHSQGSTNSPQAIPSTSGKSSAASSPDNSMSQFCQILKNGFDSVSVKISEKLDKVGKDVTKGMEKVGKDLHERIEELATPKIPYSESESEDGDFCFGSEQGSHAGDKNGDHQSGAGADSVSVSSGQPSFFKQLNKTPRDERIGEKVNDDLAEATDRFFRKPMSADKYKELKEKYVRPENVAWVKAPEIPFNVYRRLPSDFKNTDKALHFIQEQLCPVINSMIYAMDKLGDGDLEGGRDILSDSLSTMGYVFKTNITEKHRSLLKGKLPEDFKVLVSDKCQPSPTNLLGDMSENAKKVAETEKLANQMDRFSKQKNQNQNQKKGFYRGSPYKGDFRRGDNYGRKYENQKRGYDRRNSYDKGGRDNKDNRPFRRGGQRK